MRKVVLGLGISFDGYIARKNGAVDWLSMDWDYDWTAFFTTIDVVLMGRKTWEVALGMNAPKKKSKSKAKNPYGAMESYVFSKTLKESGVEGVKIVSRDLKKFIENLKAKDGKNIWLSGGGELAKSFLDARFGGRDLSRRYAAFARFGFAAFSRTHPRNSASLRFRQCVQT